MGIGLRGMFAVLALAVAAPAAIGQSETVLFWQPGFPTVDSAALSFGALQQGFSGAQAVDTTHLRDALANPQTRLLVMPYGSAYPEYAWGNIRGFLARGGNLIVLGGKPFTQAAYLDNGQWRLRRPDVEKRLELLIYDYQETPGSEGLRFAANPDVMPQIPRFEWKRAFSPVIRLSVSPRFPAEIGSTGNEDSFLTTLAWGERDGHRLAAPVILIDHVAERFAGGRWIFVACDADAGTLGNPQLLSALQTLALRRNDRFTLRPRVAVFLPGEALEFQFRPAQGEEAKPGDVLKVAVHAEDGAAREFEFPADAGKTIMLPPDTADGHGLHTVEATLWRSGAPVWTYRTGFWMRDRAWLLSGPKLSAGADYFLLDGKPLPVVGATYMASDVDRAYLWEPNAFVWDQDMRQIRAAGLNMLRSGIWSGWDLVTNPDKSMTEETLRSIEAFLMTARKYGLPAQFNLFAFIPDLTGKGHPYLTQRQEQDRYVASVAGRFHDVPFLAWDLINEPSANRNLWHTLPDPEEEADWRSWLLRRDSESGNAPRSDPLPPLGAFDGDAVRNGFNPLPAYDYQMFTQGVFRKWVERQRDTIRATGSDQLITVGQDEGGVAGRLSPAFFSPDVSFTTTHTWWDFDSILWAGLMAKMPGEPMLVQEMGEQRRVTQDSRLRLSAEEESWQLERKLAISFAQGAGGIEWVWNVNAMMANDNETSIGAVRPDGTEKPEARVLAGFAMFARQHPESFVAIEPPPITVVVSQAFMYTGMWGMAVDVQKKAVRALAYNDRQPLRMLPENRLAELGRPKLVILPAAQVLTDAAWQQLLNYVDEGGCLLVTGPVEYDERWQKVDRLTPLGLSAKFEPLTMRQSSIALPGSDRRVPVSYPSAVQTAPIEIMRFTDGAPVKTIHHGKGTILWAADPVEFAEGYDASSALYRYAAAMAGIQPPFTEREPLSFGVLAFPTVMKDAILYSFSSESVDDQTVDIVDSATKARLHFALPAQHGAVVLINRADGAVLASYGMESRQSVGMHP